MHYPARCSTGSGHSAVQRFHRAQSSAHQTMPIRIAVSTGRHNPTFEKFVSAQRHLHLRSFLTILRTYNEVLTIVALLKSVIFPSGTSIQGGTCNKYTRALI